MDDYRPLTLAECSRLALELKDRLEPASAELNERYGIELEAYARLSVLGVQLRQARAARGLSLDEAAASLALEPHALKSVENLSPKLSHSVLLAYVDWLGLSDWFAAWGRQNPDLIEALSLV